MTAPAAPPTRARSALAALSGVAAVVLGAVALAASTGRAPVVSVAPAASGETSAAELVEPGEPTIEPETTLAPPVTTLCPASAVPSGCEDPSIPTTTAPPATEQTLRPSTTLRPAPAPAPAPAPDASHDTLPDPPDPNAPPPLPAGITVEVHPATNLVAGRATSATVRIRNASNQAFWIFTGCGVTWVAIFDQAGNDVTDRTNAEPCGTPGHYFSPQKLPARSSLERVLPLTPLRTASGAHLIRAAWARDTGPGLIHYIDAPAVPVQVAAAG